MVPLDGSSCIAGAVFDVQLYRCEPCRAGTFHDTASDSCLPCTIGTVSVDPGATTCLNCRDLQATFYQDEEGQAECKDCPEGADCSSGVSAVGQKGYWRDSPDRSHFYECFNPEDGTCHGESSPYAGQGCQEGHEGPLCSVCSADYARGGRYDLLSKCAMCSGDGENPSYTAVITTGVMLFVLCALLAFLYWPYLKYSGIIDQRSAAAGYAKHVIRLSNGVQGLARRSFIDFVMSLRPSSVSKPASNLDSKESIWDQMYSAWYSSGIGSLVDDVTNMAPYKTLAPQLLASFISFSQVFGSFARFTVQWPASLSWVIAALNLSAFFSLDIPDIDMKCELAEIVRSDAGFYQR
eukprot:gene15893-18847_t